MKQQDLKTWHTKREAAEILNVSEKTIERLARERKRVQWAIRRRPGKRPEPVYNPDDITSLKQEQGTVDPAVLAEGESKPKISTALAPRSREMLPAAFAELAAALQAPRLSLSDKLCLTIEEAAHYTGLTESLLRRKIKSRELYAFRDRGWKIRRADLDKFVDTIDTCPTETAEVLQNRLALRL